MSGVSGVTLSIIIVNWNVRDLLRDCLASLRREMCAPLTHEVIVVDNASHDDSVAMIRAEFPEVKLIASPTNTGFAQGCEDGYAIARGDIVLLLNPDTVVLDHAIDAMTAQFAVDPSLGIVGSCLLNGDRSFQRATGGAFPSLANLAWNYLFLNKLLPARLAPAPLFLERAVPGLSEIDWVSGASLMFRRAAVGPRIFDPSIFMFGEDMELCHRIGRAGWKVKLSGDTRIVHFHGQSFKQQNSIAEMSSVYKGPRIFFRRNHSRIATLFYDSILFIGYMVRWPSYWLANRIRPGRGYDELARFSRRYIGIMLRDAARI